MHDGAVWARARNGIERDLAQQIGARTTRFELSNGADFVEQAGACAVVVEGVPRDLAQEITQKLSIPTIGIGAGPDCDGQVLVLHDVVGLSDTPLKFTKHYADLRNDAIRATEAFINEVRDGSWPDDQHSFH